MDNDLLVRYPEYIDAHFLCTQITVKAVDAIFFKYTHLSLYKTLIEGNKRRIHKHIYKIHVEGIDDGIGIYSILNASLHCNIGQRICGDMKIEGHGIEIQPS